MANGWTEFLEQIKRQAEEKQGDLQPVWAEFLRLSQMSPRAQILKVFAEIVQKLPTNERAVLALFVSSLLSPLDWPPEWEQHRLPLVEALESLLHVLDPERSDSWPALLGLARREDEGMIHSTGRLMLLNAIYLLRTPCRRDELRAVSSQCDAALYACFFVYRRLLAGRAGQPLAGPLLEARMRLAAAFERYAQTARALNSAVGEVLFTVLDDPLGIPET